MKALFILFFSLMLSASVHADGASTKPTSLSEFKEGKHYLALSPQVNINAIKKGNVEVIEFFWYGCPHCYQFEPTFNAWKKTKPKNVTVRRLPAIFNKGWIPHARAFFAAEQLGITDQVHNEIFKAIHAENKRLYSLDSLAEFMASKSDKDVETIKKAMKSFATENYVRKAMQIARMSRLQGVPAVMVNGKYLTSGRYAGSNENVVNVISHLVEKESK